MTRSHTPVANVPQVPPSQASSGSKNKVLGMNAMGRPLSMNTNPNTNGASTEAEDDDSIPVASVEGEKEEAQKLNKAKADLDKNIKGLEDTVTQVMSMLKNYYGGNEKIMTKSWGKEFSKDEIDFLSEKIARAVEHELPLTVGVMGSSVAAGHDNCQYDSFEAQLERTLKDMFKAGGIEFTVRNAGQGGGCGDSFSNQVFCIRNMLGDDVDFTVYSWTYFEAGQRNIDQTIHEAFIRWSLLMDRAPSPVFWYAGDTGHVGNGLIAKYDKFGANTLFLTKGIKTEGRYIKHGNGWGDIGDGMHNTTRYGENLEEERKNSLGVMYRNWHPGPLGFQIASDAYAWRLLVAAKRAVERLKGGERFSISVPLITRTQMGESSCQDEPYGAGDHGSRYFRKEFCDVDEPPNCIAHELPAYGKPQVRYASASDDLNPMYKVFTRELTEKKNKPSHLIPRDEKVLPECQHYDFCRGYRGDFMTYRLPRMETGFVAVCCVIWDADCGKQLTTIDYFMDDRKLPPARLLTGYGKSKCVLVQESLGTAQAEGGHYYLSMNMSSIPNVYISHVVAG